ncbi:MAG: hypothetical protein K2X27_17625 [Candidatus Obscuribacterales bacterium]|nr:hypothetical protein [Candidatus Obscuribacterales bacterium]
MAFANKKILLAGLAAILTLGATHSVQAADEQPALRNPLPGSASTAAITPERVKRDYWLAWRLAQYEWLDKVAEADPRIIAAICSHSGPAKLLARHKHLDKIAESDHYLCRRLTQWNGATEKLLRNPYADKVIALDPQGMAYALNKKPSYGRMLGRHEMLDSLADSNRDFPRELSKHIR